MKKKELFSIIHYHQYFTFDLVYRTPGVQNSNYSYERDCTLYFILGKLQMPLLYNNKKINFFVLQKQELKKGATKRTEEKEEEKTPTFKVPNKDIQQAAIKIGFEDSCSETCRKQRTVEQDKLVDKRLSDTPNRVSIDSILSPKAADKNLSTTDSIEEKYDSSVTLKIHFLAILAAATQSFFCLQVDILPAIECSTEEQKKRYGIRKRKLEQLNTVHINNDLYFRREYLHSSQGSYMAWIGVTMFDLYPGAGWSYVFGEANFGRGVGVFSFIRYLSPLLQQSFFMSTYLFVLIKNPNGKIKNKRIIYLDKLFFLI
ncbi:hypothetical protein RFI_12851 [Reticulomyxa filosa]|uniref:Uncharacterized protein n=1 Tax=Reticulomyxa filosa TaxID=46433 RepID=X6NDA1_RETFI|nr:hypothetical protein RFI_12851 [Reticulomyxa filosa]|eukprot:ETO24305.1 hypothetical protein RFI_12851 [Reticulomyxa filosa]